VPPPDGQTAAKKRSVHCSNCGEEGHNKKSCLRNQQVETRSRPATNRNPAKSVVEEVLRSRRNVGEIADESDDEDDIEQADDMADLDIDDWDPDELEWVDFEPSKDSPPVNEDGTINDGWPKFKVEDCGPNIEHEDVNTRDFDIITDMRDVFSLFFTDTIVHQMITSTNITIRSK
jgi:hypothetical protein